MSRFDFNIFVIGVLSVPCLGLLWNESLYQSHLLLAELFKHSLINVSYLTACYLYQVMMTLHFLNDVANDA